MMFVSVDKGKGSCLLHNDRRKWQVIGMGWLVEPQRFIIITVIITSKAAYNTIHAGNTHRYTDM